MRIEFSIEGRAIAVEADGDVSVSVSRVAAAPPAAAAGEKPPVAREETHAAPQGEAHGATGGGDLYSRLCALRKGLAEAENVPPFVVFKDSTLHEIAEKRPQGLEALSGIGGIGAVKLEKYGERLLAVIGEGAAA